MTGDATGTVGFWRTVRLLLRAGRRRSAARRAHQQELLQNRTKRRSNPLQGLALLGVVMLAAFAHGIFWWTLDGVLVISEYHVAERHGKLLVTESFMRGAFEPSGNRDDAVRDEARHREFAFGGERADHEEVLRAQIAAHGRDGFVIRSPAAGARGIRGIATAGPLALKSGLVVVVLWFLMMALQGEGLELDVQRRRHPMWEWLFSHPIPPGAAFLAEMLTPLAANPIFAAAPIFCGLTLASVHAIGVGLGAGLVVGAAAAVAAGCFSKAIEIGAMVRLSPRSRGAVIGIMSWVGYSALMLGFVANTQRGLLVALVSAVDHVGSLIPSALLRWMLGVRPSGVPSIALAVASCLAVAAAVVAGSVWLSARATDAGIARGFADVAPAPRPRAASRRRHLIRDPLLRKELLWFARDRGAIVQAVLIPLTMGASQAFNLRSVAERAGHSWHWFCGLAVLCGTYFLLILGPRSLTSEGGALWIALTWPRGLEPLLKAKARLWWVIASVIVLGLLAVAAVRFPADVPKVALVACGWIVFGRSLAEKTVTLVVAPSSSGEPEPVPKGRQWAATLGTFSFASGIITRNWHLAALGVMFSTLTSAAMWQNFRERLPCLFDPSSERLPPPPTLMHAMVAITAMVDGMSIVAIPILLALQGQEVWVAQAAAYGLTATIVWLITSEFLVGRGVRGEQIWRWPVDDRARVSALAGRLRAHLARPAVAGIAVGLGLVFGVLALGYQWWLWQIPSVAESLEPLAKHLAEHPGERWAMLLVAVGFAPPAEEYLFRGLLYRALDREWGGWRAVVGSALFFAVYHPPLAWLPVGLMGLVLAVLFKVTGRLWPCVVVHAVYNATVSLAV